MRVSYYHLPVLLLLAPATSLRRVAIVTGGTRGIGRGISEVSLS